MLTKLQLTTEELLILQSELHKRGKSLGLAYLMLLGGHLGLHRFYLGKKVSGAVQLVLFLTAMFFYLFMSLAFEFIGDAAGTASLVLFAVSALALAIWIIIDLFLLPRWIRDWNEREERQLLKRLESMREGIR